MITALLINGRGSDVTSPLRVVTSHPVSTDDHVCRDRFGAVDAGTFSRRACALCFSYLFPRAERTGLAAEPPHFQRLVRVNVSGWVYFRRLLRVNVSDRVYFRLLVRVNVSGCCVYFRRLLRVNVSDRVCFRCLVRVNVSGGVYGDPILVGDPDVDLNFTDKVCSVIGNWHTNWIINHDLPSSPGQDNCKLKARLSAYIVITFGVRKINISGINRANPNQFWRNLADVHRKFWVRSVGEKWGQRIPGQPAFCSFTEF